jgi:hypothetical protein
MVICKLCKTNHKITPTGDDHICHQEICFLLKASSPVALGASPWGTLEVSTDRCSSLAADNINVLHRLQSAHSPPLPCSLTILHLFNDCRLTNYLSMQRFPDRHINNSLSSWVGFEHGWEEFGFSTRHKASMHCNLIIINLQRYGKHI